jgi:hypothetical protein
MPGAEKPKQVYRYIEETLGKLYRDILKANKSQTGVNTNRMAEEIR